MTLVDSKYTSLCINKAFVQKHNLLTQHIPLPIPVYNTDRTLNQNSQITEFVQLQMNIQNYKESIEFGVTNLRKTNVFIGFKWLKAYNSTIDWLEQTLVFD